MNYELFFCVTRWRTKSWDYEKNALILNYIKSHFIWEDFPSRRSSCLATKLSRTVFSSLATAASASLSWLWYEEQLSSKPRSELTLCRVVEEEVGLFLRKYGRLIAQCCSDSSMFSKDWSPFELVKENMLFSNRGIIPSADNMEHPGESEAADGVADREMRRSHCSSNFSISFSLGPAWT